MTIDGIFYQNDIRAVLKSGPQTVQEIKTALKNKKIILDESQILDALDKLIKRRIVVRSDGKFAMVTAE